MTTAVSRAGDGTTVRTADGTEVPPGDRGDHGGRRRPGKVVAVNWDDDHGDAIAYVIVQHDGGGAQGFGGLCMPPALTARFLTACAHAAGRCVPTEWRLEERLASSRLAREQVTDCLVGARVTSLWARGANNETMEGIEGAGGRLTLTGFRRAHGFEDPGTLARAREDLDREVAWAERRAAEARARHRQEGTPLRSSGRVDLGAAFWEP